MKTSLWNQIKTRALVLFMAPHSSTLAWKIPWMEQDKYREFVNNTLGREHNQERISALSFSNLACVSHS